MSVNTVKLKYYIEKCEAYLLSAKNDAVRKAFSETLAKLKKMGGYTVNSD